MLNMTSDLPATHGEPEAGKPAAQVLVVDDMATNRELVKAVLPSLHYEVCEAENGTQALRMLTEQKFDVVLLDVMMPEMDGFEVCRRIRANSNFSLLPVIILTTLDHVDAVVKGMTAGATEYIFKPFKCNELLARIQGVIKHKRLTDQLDDIESVLFALARAVEAKDENTGDHCDRLSHMGLVFGGELGLEYEDLQALRRGGVLHDIGKIGIPDAILLKPGPLDDAEWVVMKQHTIIGEQLCSPLKTMQRTVSIIRHHHERWNGSGYPDGLRGDEIPFLARVFQIVDIYDALATSRPYKKAFPQEKVIAIMEEETKKGFWDPELVAKFLGIVNTRPNDLQRPANSAPDKSARILENLTKIGYLEWGRANQKKAP